MVCSAARSAKLGQEDRQTNANCCRSQYVLLPRTLVDMDTEMRALAIALGAIVLTVVSGIERVALSDTPTGLKIFVIAAIVVLILGSLGAVVAVKRKS